jgi:hypothetical protein
MKKLFAVLKLVMALFIVNFTANAEASVVKLPSGPAPGQTGCPQNISQCIGTYNLTDMGQFDLQTGEWIWNPQFLDTLMIANLDDLFVTTLPGQGTIITGFGPDWLNIITPTLESLPSRVTGRLERRVWPADANMDNEMRLAVKPVSDGVATSHINLYLGDCWKAGPGGVEVNTLCNDPDVTRVLIFAQNKTNDTSVVDPLRTPSTPLPGTGKAYTSNDIESIKWIEKGTFGTFLITDNLTYNPIYYDMNKKFWNPSGQWTTETELHYTWPIPTLTEGEMATFDIKIKNVDQPIRAHSIVHSLADMPIVLATFKSTEYNILKEKEKKSGKIVIKAEEVEITRNNITVREIDDPSGGKALVIQWPEPDIALFGGVDLPKAPFPAPVPPNTQSAQYQVKVFVGATSKIGTDFTEVFLFYDLPAQMGTCVVEGPSYDTILAKIQEKGFTLADLRVRIFYREQYWNTPFINGQFMLSYQNRTQSIPVPINE